MANDSEYRIAKLDLQAGDIVVMKFDRHLSSENVAAVQRQIKPLLPDGVKAMILDCAVDDVSVLTRAEIEAKAA